MAAPTHRKPKPAPSRGWSNTTPQGRADAKKEAARKAKIKKMDNAYKEKAAKPVDKAKEQAKEAAKREAAKSAKMKKLWSRAKNYNAVRNAGAVGTSGGVALGYVAGQKSASEPPNRKYTKKGKAPKKGNK